MNHLLKCWQYKLELVDMRLLGEFDGGARVGFEAEDVAKIFKVSWQWLN